MKELTLIKTPDSEVKYDNNRVFHVCANKKLLERINLRLQTVFLVRSHLWFNSDEQKYILSISAINFQYWNDLYFDQQVLDIVKEVLGV